MIDIPSHILESMWFPLPESVNIWHASHELLDAIPVFAAWETQRSVFFLQHIVIVPLHTFPLDPTLDIFVLFPCRKRVVGIDLWIRLKATLSIAFPWSSDVIDQWSAGAGVYFRMRRRRWWLRLRVCDVFNVFEVGKPVQVFDRISFSVGFTMLSGFNASGSAANYQLLQLCNWKVFMMV